MNWLDFVIYVNWYYDWFMIYDLLGDKVRLFFDR